MSLRLAIKRSLEDREISTKDSTKAPIGAPSHLPSPDSHRGSESIDSPTSKRPRIHTAANTHAEAHSGSLFDVPNSRLSSLASDLSDLAQAIEEEKALNLKETPRTPSTPKPAKVPKAQKNTPTSRKSSGCKTQKRTPALKRNNGAKTQEMTPICRPAEELLTRISALRCLGRASAHAAYTAITNSYTQHPVEAIDAGEPVTSVQADYHLTRILPAGLTADDVVPTLSVVSTLEPSEFVDAQRSVTSVIETVRNPSDTHPALTAVLDPTQYPATGSAVNTSTIRCESAVSEITEKCKTQSVVDNPESVSHETELYLWNLAEQIQASRPQGKRPPPSELPEIWADGRQDLCETLPYYRAYQGAGYCAYGSARAFMFDGNAHPRDYMDQNVVISRAGGGMTKDETGKMTSKGDQSESAQVASVDRNMTQFNPVVLLIGGNNPTSPSQPPHPYSVMDWFKPTHVWFEKSKGHRMIRYRFEKLLPYDKCWWTPRGWKEAIRLGNLDPPMSLRCPTCKHKSLQVYMNGWMCLEPTCDKFWKSADGIEPQEESLVYDPRFITAYTPWPHRSKPSPIRPALLTVSSVPIQGENVTSAAWRGFACPMCGRCNARIPLERWECRGTGCGFTYTLQHTLIPVLSLRDPHYPLGHGYASSRDKWPGSFKVQTKFLHNYRIVFFEIPGVEGFVAHLIANQTVNEEPNGPNDMFERLQVTPIGLRRIPLESKQLKGGMLTQHFAVNYGMPYKFTGGPQTYSFDNAAPPIKNARSRLNWASRLVSPNLDHEFNEVLALGYFEGQKMNYHDDGENGLDPTIATLSLGCTAEMKLRMKAKHYRGMTKSRNYEETAPIPGCLKYEARKAAHDDLMLLKATDRDAYRAKKRALPDDLGLESKGTAEPLIITLGHGDIVIMHGTDIQKYFEHEVEHKGKLRYALTCRYIDPDSLAPQDRPTYVVRPDDGTYDGSLLPAAK